MTHTPMEDELLALLTQLPEWSNAKRHVVEACATGASQDEVVQICTRELAAGGFQAEAMLSHIPAELLSQISADDLKRLREGLPLIFTAMVVADIQGQTFNPLEFSGGAYVSYANGAPLVYGVASGIDPERAISAFADMCYRTFPAESFTRTRVGRRNAEWTARMARGETAREIALTDSRAGLAAEVRADPDDYADEVKRGERKVIKAVQRFRSRWTKIGDSMSTDSE